MNSRIGRVVKRVLVISVIAALLASNAAFAKSSKKKSIDYYITVDQTNQITTAYRISDMKIVRQMLCTTGLNGATPNALYTMPVGKTSMDRTAWYHFKGFRCYAKYPTRVFKGVLFHSITYNKNTEDSIAKSAIREYGYPASHGCIRLLVNDAKWIQDNCPIGTKVLVYESGIKDQNLWNLLFQEHYTIESGKSYEEYLGGAITRYSAPDEIVKLQGRLRELGYFTGKATGTWDEETSSALLLAQVMTNSEISGNVSREFMDLINSNDAPAIPGFDFKDYMYEPAVRLVQKNLKTLGLYNGEVDGLFDFEVSEAAAKFESIYGYEQTGTPSVIEQEAMQYEADRAKEICGEGVTGEIVQDTIQTATVNFDKKIRIRSKPDTESSEIATVKPGTRLLLIEKSDTWSKVQYGGNVGFMKNKYLEFGSYSVSYLKCTGPNGEYIIGNTLEETMKGKKQPASKFDEYYNEVKAERKRAVKQAAEIVSNSGVAYGSNIAEKAHVNTGDSNAELNLRAKPASDGEVITTLANGTEVILKERRADGWSLISIDDNLQGYVVSQYLETAVDLNTELMAGGATDATVSTEEGFTYVYRYADKESEKIGFTTTGSTVSAYGSSNGFTYICYTNYKNEEEEPNSYGYVPTDTLTSEYRDFSAEQVVNDDGAGDDDTVRATVIDSVGSTPMFAEANASATVIATIGSGTILNVLEAVDGSNWAKIEYQGVEGYVENAALRFDNE